MRRSSKTNRQMRGVDATKAGIPIDSIDLLSSQNKNHSRKSSYSRQDLLQLHSDLDTIPEPERQPPR